MSVQGGLVDILSDASGVEPARLIRWLRQEPLATTAGELLDRLLAAIDNDLSRALDAIYSEPRFQELERNWRSLFLVVDRLAGISNVDCDFINCSLSDLVFDFEDAPNTRRSSLYKIAHMGEFTFCGRPYAAIITSYTLTEDARHFGLLREAGALGALCAIPFVTHATPELYASSAWHAFRATPEARFIAMMEGEYLLRDAFDGTGSVPYRQARELAAWGQGASVLAVSMALSFWRYRIASHVFAPGCWVDRLPARDGRTARRVVDWDPSEVIARGGNPIVDIAPGIVNAIEGRTAALPVASALPNVPQDDLEMNARLSALFLAGRIMQTAKIAHRGQIGSWKPRDQIAVELDAWLREQAPGVFASVALSFIESPTCDWPYEQRIELVLASGAGTIVLSDEVVPD